MLDPLGEVAGRIRGFSPTRLARNARHRLRGAPDRSPIPPAHLIYLTIGSKDSAPAMYDRLRTVTSPSEPIALSVVLPVYNEEENLRELHSRLTETLRGLGLAYEIVFVDDGSRDDSVERIRRISAGDGHVVGLVLSRNFGHQIALTAGLEHARGEAVVLMDSDLQDPPELIPELVARWREGFDVVHAQRRARPGESVFKRATAWSFYRLLRVIADVDIPRDTGDFRLLSSRAAEALRSMRERSRFLRGMVSWLGFRQIHVTYDRPARTRGESSYSIVQMLRLAMRAAFSFSSFPVSLLGVLGLLVSLGALVGLALGSSPAASGLFFLGGVQLIGLFILGRYVAGVAEDVRGRPLYVVRERLAGSPPFGEDAKRQSVIPASEA